MIFKLLEHHLSGQRMAEYLTGAQDSKGMPREAFHVVCGDPHRLARLIDHLPFKYKYSSCCIGFHPSDDPGTQEMDDLVENALEILLAGMRPHRTAHTVVRHESKEEHFDFHIVVARVDLITGRSFNPTPPGCYGWMHLLLAPAEN